jgi:dolichol-phosphate mannosyltransferase
MVAWAGFRQLPYRYERPERFAGSTKYPLSKMISFAFDALTGFSSAPLKLASYAAFWLSIGSVALMVYILVSWLAGQAIQGWTSLMLVVIMLGAIQMFVLSMIGEYIGRLYGQSKQRPLYIVQDVVGGSVNQARLGISVAEPQPERE